MTDFNDMFSEQGPEAVRENINNAEAPEKARRRLQPYSLNELKDFPKKKYLIKNFLDKESLSVVYGESNCGKTFVVINIAAHICMGLPWVGLRAKKGCVVYIAAEGGQSVIDRITAAKLRNQLTDDAKFFLIPTGIDLRGKDDAEEIIKELGFFNTKVDMIVVDTLARAIAGGDENNSEDMGAFIKNCDKIREATGAHVMIVHHAGKDVQKGARGHSSLRGAVDTEVFVTQDKESKVIVAEVRKQRDGATGGLFHFMLENLPVRQDEDGESVTSCVLNPITVHLKNKKPNGQKGRAIEVLERLIASEGVDYSPGGSAQPVKAVKQDKLFQALHDAKISKADKPDNIRRVVVRVMKELNDDGITSTFDGYVWIVDNVGQV